MKLNIKIILGFLLSFIVLGITGVCAANIITSNEIKFDNTNSNLKSTDTQSAIDELYSKVKPIEFKLGDYVQMTPTKTTFNVPKTLTGYSSDQTINPSELTLWRVIRINDDGTVDMVSEYVSSSDIYFQGLTGYKNYIGALNYLAKQYENSKYTVSSRHVGYNGQTEYLTDTSKFIYPAPWTSVTSNNSNESLGGGDILYMADENLIKSAIGVLTAKKTSGIMSNYWEASRIYFYYNESDYDWCGRVMITAGYSGRPSSNNLYDYKYSNTPNMTEYSMGNPIRPIVTLKSNISNISGNGTSESPYILN